LIIGQNFGRRFFRPHNILFGSFFLCGKISAPWQHCCSLILPRLKSPTFFSLPLCVSGPQSREFQCIDRIIFAGYNEVLARQSLERPKAGTTSVRLGVFDEIFLSRNFFAKFRKAKNYEISRNIAKFL
jgi:hypothetical protein